LHDRGVGVGVVMVVVGVVVVVVGVVVVVVGVVVVVVGVVVVVVVVGGRVIEPPLTVAIGAHQLAKASPQLTTTFPVPVETL
jgi:hypothetical protein